MNFPIIGDARPEGREPLRDDPPGGERHAHGALGLLHRPEQEGPGDDHLPRQHRAQLPTSSCASSTRSSSPTSHKVATPANWKDGDDCVIVPSRSTDEQAKSLFRRDGRRSGPTSASRRSRTSNPDSFPKPTGARDHPRARRQFVGLDRSAACRGFAAANPRRLVAARPRAGGRGAARALRLSARERGCEVACRALEHREGGAVVRRCEREDRFVEAGRGERREPRLRPRRDRRSRHGRVRRQVAGA